jgi:hypothetical protein
MPCAPCAPLAVNKAQLALIGGSSLPSGIVVVAIYVLPYPVNGSKYITTSPV